MIIHKIKTGFVIPHYVNIIIDLILFFISIVLANLIRFNFSIPDRELTPLPGIILWMIGVRFIIAVLTRSYHGILKYNSLLDMLKIFLYTTLGSVIFILTNVISYYLINNKLFIPLTIIIIEFLLTSFLLILSRILIKMSYSSSIDKKTLERLNRK